jgi:ABC-type multidrug transport system ATPase subunit
VLARVSGAARPHKVVALLGPSGAGKSTLLDILAARKSQGSLSGEVMVNGRPRDAAAFRARTAYVPQARCPLPSRRRRRHRLQRRACALRHSNLY